MTPIDHCLIALTFALGFFLLRAKLCTVACLRDSILQGQHAGLLRLAVATSAAGVVLLSAARWSSAAVMLPIDSHEWTRIACGGVMLGVGSMINGACYLGSIAYLGSGNSNYLITLCGIGLGLRLSDGLPPWSSSMVSSAQLQMAGASVIGLVVFASILLLAVASAVGSESPQQTHRRHASPWPAALCGVLAGALFAHHPNWSYASVIDSIAHLDQRAIDAPGLVSAGALFIGAIVSALLLQRFKPSPPKLLKSLRCLSGGAVMAYGATLIPGGNDTLLLWSIPGLAGYGLLAYATMAATIALAAWVEGRIVARKIPAATAPHA